MAKKKLGQGMDLLFMDSVEDSGKETTTLRLSLIEPNKNQPRTHFDEESIVNLAESIRIHGVLQPLLVRPLESGAYQIVAGERRWRASRMAGLTEVPVVIKELDDRETAQIALIENLQREDLNPIEEAQGYRGLMLEFDMTQNEVAQTVGRSRAAISNSLRLLDLEESVQKMLVDGEITVGHGKVILGLNDLEEQKELAKSVVAKALTVRQTEQALIKIRDAGNAELNENDNKKIYKDAKYFEKSSVYSEIEIALTDLLGEKVSVNANKDGSSEVKISFSDEEALKGFAKRISVD
ncbi:MAG: ParB/RepB/Spo0J family partition protein [Clostridiales bacterium]|nr:ParB/RepB/Spo0J family partition protein [Clostridiales bacterium]